MAYWAENAKGQRVSPLRIVTSSINGDVSKTIVFPQGLPVADVRLISYEAVKASSREFSFAFTDVAPKR
jgi:hypothetical protein